MLDAAQARIVAYYEENGGFICAAHANDKYARDINAYKDEHRIKDDDGGWNFNLWEAFDAFGLQAYSRYDIDTMADERLYDLDMDSFFGAAAGATVEEVIEAYTAIRCSVDEEVI